MLVIEGINGTDGNEPHEAAADEPTPSAVAEFDGQTEPTRVTDQTDTQTIRFWDWVQARFLGRDLAAERAERLTYLSQAVQRYPDNPTNYVLRGELYMELGRYEAAHADFTHALACARVAVQEHRWGFVSQAMQDRALRGKRLAALSMSRSGHTQEN